jgi:glutamate synthase (NADPH/NADH) small chain
MCAFPRCAEGCPWGVDIQRFLDHIVYGEFLQAAYLILDTLREVGLSDNTIQAIFEQDCPYEVQCERKCLLDATRSAVAIGRLERFVIDYEMRLAQFHGRLD